MPYRQGKGKGPGRSRPGRPPLLTEPGGRPRLRAANAPLKRGIGEFWGYPQSRAFAERLLDCEEDRTLRAVLVGMLREAERSGPS
jgi:hypothetical protein